MMLAETPGRWDGSKHQACMVAGKQSVLTLTLSWTLTATVLNMIAPRQCDADAH